MSSAACTSCGRSIPEHSRFCPECGAVQLEQCAHCGHELTANARFCASCGTPTAAEPPRPSQPVAERRVTSVLFGDLVSFTTLSEARDSEEVRELLSGYFARCRTVVARYGGTIEKFIGDAVMAVWGVPTTHEDDAERAVRAGLDLVEATAAFGVEAGAPGLAMRVGVVTGEVAVTIGATAEGMVAGDAVNTAARVQGQARPGTVWIDDQTRRLTFAAVESSPTGEHALKGKAEPMALYEVIAVVGAVGTVHRVDRVEAELLGRRGELAVVKEAFHAVADDARGRMLIVSGDPGLGKSRLGWELEKYADGLADRVRWHWGRCLAYGDGVAFSALSSAVRGRVGAIDSDGPDEITAKVAESVARFVSDETQQDWLVPRLALLLSGDAADEQFSREDLFAAWVAWFEALGADGATVVWVVDDAQYGDDGLLDFLEHLVAIARVPILVVVLTRPELLERRPHLTTSRRTIALNLEGLTPVAMAGLLGRLVPGLPAAVIDELADRAEGIPLYAVETVRALLDRGLLVDASSDDGGWVLAADVGPDELLGQGAPASLQILISSRLDALAAGDRSLLGTAAVLGTSFTLDGLSALTGLHPNVVSDRLAPLVRRDLLHSVTDRLSSEYGQFAFVQSLVRQVAYQTQSRRDRADRHVAAAAYLQGLPESSGQLSAVIAGHLDDAYDLFPATDPRRPGLAAQLLVWLENAAERARSVGSMTEALANWDDALARTIDPAAERRIRLAAATVANTAAQYERAIAYTEWLGDAGPDDAADRVVGSDAELVAEALAQRSKALRNSGRAGQARELLAAWQDRSTELLPAAGSAVSREYAAALHQLGRLDEAGSVAERAVRLAEGSGRADLLVLSLNVLANGYDDGGLPRVAAAVYRTAAELARSHHLLVELNMVLGNLAAVELNQDPPAGVRACWEAIDLATRIGDSYSVVGAAGNLAEMLRGVGDWDRVLELEALPDIVEARAAGVIEVQAILTNTALIALARGTVPTIESQVDAGDPDGYEAVLIPFQRAIAAAADGDPGTAFDVARPAVQATHERFGLSAYFPLMWPTTVDWAIEAGRYDEARELSLVVGDSPAGRITPVLRAQLARLRARIAAGDPSAAIGTEVVERQLHEAIAALTAIGYVPDTARTHAVAGRWLLDHGRAADAEAHLSAAASTFAELGAHAWAAMLGTGSARQRSDLPGRSGERVVGDAEHRAQ